MSLSSEAKRVSHLGNGSTATYSFNFKIFDQTHLTLKILNTDSAESPLTLSTDYTVTGAGETNGGSITLTNSGQDWIDGSGFLKTGYKLIIKRTVPKKQTADIRNQGDFHASTHENIFDKQVMMIQELEDDISRSVKTPDTIDSATFDPTIPSTVVDNPSTALGVNAAGDGIAIGPTFNEIANAQGYATSAEASKDLAQEWASKTDGIVDTSDYSSKAWAIGGTGVTDTASAGASKEWATKAEDSTVDGTEFSALHHAAKASASATSAATSATQAQNAVASVLWNDVVFLTNADSPYTASNSDRGKLLAVDCSGGNVTINLPSIAGLDLTSAFVLGVKKTDATGNSVVLDADGTDTVDGGATKSISVTDAGTTLIPDTDPTPDEWTTADFGSSGGNLTVNNFDGNDSTTGFSLSVDPGSENNTFVWIDGVYQQKNTYSVSGTTLTFSEAPPTGTDNIEVMIGTLLGIGAPSDGTVTRAKLADGAIGKYATTSKTSNYTLTASDDLVVCDTSGGSFTVTLPTAVGIAGKRYLIKLETAGNILDIATALSQTIDGKSAEQLRANNEFFELVSDGSNWLITGFKFNEFLNVSPAAVAAVTSGSYVSFSGNGATLNPGIFKVKGRVSSSRTGGTSNLTGLFCNISESQNSQTAIGTGGNISTSSPSFIEVPAFQSVFNAAPQVDGIWSPISEFTLDVTAQDIIYINAYMTGGTPSNFNLQVRMQCQRIG
jgi:hypothetical protein